MDTNLSVKPGKVQAISIMMLINGILNILAGLGITASIVLGTIGIGVICAPFTILPSILGIFEVIYAARLISNPPHPVKNLQTIAILEIAAIVYGNGLSLIVGILNLVFLSEPEVKSYLDSIPPEIPAV
ncbi:MAG: hypothetical protein JW704_03700 [Anaerolineaceae bacterium]|nr:hypothetical protein [Anaerolineaceae bacterium]MBN2676474.1 hypothetical protein [Anaerolineaceae bacterium]